MASGKTLESLAKQKNSQLLEMRVQSEQGGGKERIERQHRLGKYTARERIERLIDPGTFIEFDRFVTHKCTYFGLEKTKYLGDGVVTAMAEINGEKVCVYAQDFTCWGGALGAAHAKKICKIMDFALEKSGSPHWHQRLRWGQNPRRGRGPSWLRGDILSQCKMLWGYSPNISYYGALCGRGRLFPGHYRFYLYGG